VRTERSSRNLRTLKRPHKNVFKIRITCLGFKYRSNFLCDKMICEHFMKFLSNSSEVVLITGGYSL
jgi:hypothetical protein